MSAPAPRLYVPEPSDPPRHDPRAFRHAAPGSGRPQGPGGRSTKPRSAPPRDRKPGGRPPQGPGGPGKGGRGKGGSKPTRTSAPLALRLALLPIRLALIPLRLAGLVLGRITGGRPWLALVLVLGCGVIFLHAATLQTNQLIEQRDAEISSLERSTASLRNSVAELGSTDRVSRVGREAGMVFPDPEGIGYLDARKSKAERAAETFGPPSASWLPAPNRSSQNGDALNADGSPAEGGLGGTAGEAATSQGAPSTATGAAGTAGTGGEAPSSTAPPVATGTPTPSTAAPSTTSTPAPSSEAAPSDTTGTSGAAGASGTPGTTGSTDGGAATGASGAPADGSATGGATP